MLIGIAGWGPCRWSSWLTKVRVSCSCFLFNYFNEMHGKLQARPCPHPVVRVSQVEPHASISGRQRWEDMQMTCIYIISTIWNCVQELGDILAFCPNWKVSLLTFPNWQPNRPLLNNGSNIPFTSWILQLDCVCGCQNRSIPKLQSRWPARSESRCLGGLHLESKKVQQLGCSKQVLTQLRLRDIS